MLVLGCSQGTLQNFFLRRFAAAFQQFLGQQRLVAFRAKLMLSNEIAVFWANRKRWRDCDVGNAEAGKSAANKFFAGVCTGNALAHIKVKYRASGIPALKRLLMHHCGKGIIGFPHG